MNGTTLPDQSSKPAPLVLPPPMADALNIVDACLARAPLTRGEHQQAGAALQNIAQMYSALAQELSIARGELARASNSPVPIVSGTAG